MATLVRRLTQMAQVKDYGSLNEGGGSGDSLIHKWI